MQIQAPPDIPSLAELAPRPVTLSNTGLSEPFLADLISKHLAESGILDLGMLARRLGLIGSLVEDVLSFLRATGRVEVAATQGSSPFLRYNLTERGRIAAAEALLRDGYVGPAPVPLDDYERIVRAQSGRLHPLTKAHVHAAFADTVIRPELLDRLGPAVSSGRPLFIYGPAGTGKTFIARRLSRLLGPPILVPHALAVGETAVRCLDPGVHRTLKTDDHNAIMLHESFDGRYALCERPTVVAGGELTIDQLDLRYENASQLYRAPLQLRANNGLLLLDDLGRQRIAPAALFNRWIIPLEDRVDHLVLRSGQHFTVPFDLVLVFSTNLDPLRLADDAFLRRIGYKVAFETSSIDEYTAILAQECKKQAIVYEPRLASYLIHELHARHRVPLLPCHPRDLLGLAMDHCRYMGNDAIDEDALRWAWANYFVVPEMADGGTTTQTGE